MNETEIFNQAMDNSMSFSYTASGPTAMIIQVVLSLLMGWGLWKINKKLNEPHAWLSWIPVINIYSYVRASGKPNIWILWLILGAISIIIPFLGIFIFLYLYFTVLNGISKRTGNGVGTTIGLFFLPFIFLPLVGYQFNPKDEKKVEEKKEKETVEL